MVASSNLRGLRSAVFYGTAARQISKLRTLLNNIKYTFPEGIKSKGAHTVSSACYQLTAFITAFYNQNPSSEK